MNKERWGYMGITGKKARLFLVFSGIWAAIFLSSVFLLARELLQTKGKHNLYLLDEPTVGLHMQDVENFIKLLQELVEEGHSILVIEHNEQLLAACDYLIELGPQGGVHGGQLIAQGSPLALLHQNESVIAPYLKRFIKD